jgi:cell division protein YceG involved in septum cleavage
LVQKESDGGKAFKELHIHIMNIQGWIRGIHHHCSKEHLQGYLDEYHFRFNRRNNMESIFHVLIERMMQETPKRLENIQKSSAT